MSNNTKPHIQVDNLDNHHHDIPVSTNTYGGEYPSILGDIFSSFEGLDFQDINLESISHSLQSPFLNWGAPLIQNYLESSLICKSLDEKYEGISFQILESSEERGQFECHIGMPIFDHYIDENEVDMLFLQVKYDLNSIFFLPLEYFNLSSSLEHYSLYLDNFDVSDKPAAHLNPFDLYSADHGCNHVQD